MNFSSGANLDFTQAGAPVVGQKMEPKICEWGCGGTFIRPVPVMQKYGQKVCPGCLRRKEELRESRRKFAALKIPRDKESRRIRVMRAA